TELNAELTAELISELDPELTAEDTASEEASAELSEELDDDEASEAVTATGFVPLQPDSSDTVTAMTRAQDKIIFFIRILLSFFSFILSKRTFPRNQ
ncbi:MAG: hypothetical protein P4M02_10405, partial [Clostridia bacterium]|nr:hypothetical protein [Clostridia bacterium]